MADIIFWKANDFRGTLYSKVFEVADYEFDIGSKKNYEKKKFPIFWYFSPNLAPYWISYWTKLNFDHGFLKSTPKTIRKHGFRLQISRFQS